MVRVVFLDGDFAEFEDATGWGFFGAYLRVEKKEACKKTVHKTALFSRKITEHVEPDVKKTTVAVVAVNQVLYVE